MDQLLNEMWQECVETGDWGLFSRTMQIEHEGRAKQRPSIGLFRLRRVRRG